MGVWSLGGWAVSQNNYIAMLWVQEGTAMVLTELGSDDTVVAHNADDGGDPGDTRWRGHNNAL
eukprot:670959-Lingulodinium_polyedra.AAC.1